MPSGGRNPTSNCSPRRWSLSLIHICDEKTGEISVVAGLNADGTPKRTPAKAENAQSFLQFDRHGDVLDLSLIHI